MLSFLPAPVIGVLNSLLLLLNTLVWCLLLYIPALLKLTIPHKGFGVLCTKLIIRVAEIWVACNSGWMKLTQSTCWEVTGVEELKQESWYLVLSNHQSWVDILAMQRVFHGKAPFLKVLSEAAVGVGAGDRFGLVGAGFPVHEALFAPVSGEAPRKTR